MAAFEGLENRRFFSSSITFANGVLSLNGDPNSGNSLTASLTNGGKQVSASVGNGKLLAVTRSAIKQVVITGGAGNDYVYVDTGITVPVSITGGDGRDVVRGGGGVNTIAEGNGNDWVSGRGTTNLVRAGNGNNTLLGAGGNDTLIAGDGNNSIDGAAGDDSIIAGNGNDTVTGDAGNDYIQVGNGTDSINGGLGNDRLIAGTGLTTVIAGSGANSVTTGNPADAAWASGGGSIAWLNLDGTPVAATTPVPLGPSGAPKWLTYPAAPAATAANGVVTAAAPQAVLQLLDTAQVAGIGVVVRGAGSVLNAGSPIDANYQWNFGDVAGTYDSLTGFNASHIYATPGTYTISLTVTNSAGLQSTAAAQVTIAADTRRDVYVDAQAGNDANTGATPAQAVATAARAGQLVGNDTNVFFARGQTFPLTNTLKLGFHDVVVGAYGTGAQPVLAWATTAGGAVEVSTNTTAASGVTIEDLTLTSLYGQANPGLTPMAIAAGGYDTAVLRCTFEYVQYAVNGNGGPVGLTVQDNNSPLADGIQGYFLWDQGNDLVVLGNTVASSVHEHVMRTSGANEILAAYNHFTNNDGKGCIEIHTGSYAWVTNNTVTNGDIRVGPLGLWGEAATTATDTAVIQDNAVNNSAVNVFPGSHHISIRNNVIRRDSAQMIDVAGIDSAGIRESADIRILNNTGISNGNTGNFLKVEGPTLGITLVNNLLVEPNLATGGYNAAPVYVSQGSLSSFTSIGNNVWQAPAAIYSFAQGGVNFIGTSNSNAAGYQTPAEWNAQAQVGTDVFANTTIDAATLAPVAGTAAATAGTVQTGVFGDYYGNARPTAAAWTVGAVQD